MVHSLQFTVYLAHILLIHILALFGVVAQGRPLSDMTVLSTFVNDAPQLKGYGFNLWVVYATWIGLIFALYPLCKWFDRYKRLNLQRYWWLGYL